MLLLVFDLKYSRYLYIFLLKYCCIGSKIIFCYFFHFVVVVIAIECAYDFILYLKKEKKEDVCVVNVHAPYSRDREMYNQFEIPSF